MSLIKQYPQWRLAGCSLIASLLLGCASTAPQPRSNVDVQGTTNTINTLKIDEKTSDEIHENHMRIRSNSN